MNSFIQEIADENFFFMTSENFKTFSPSFYGYAFSGNDFYLRTNPSQSLLDKYSAGVFVNIVEDDKQYIIQQDYYCGFGLYIFKENNFWAISNSLLYIILKLKDKFNLHINMEYFRLYFTQTVCVASDVETIIKEISELSQGEYLIIDKYTGELLIDRNEYNQFAINIYSKEAIELIEMWRLRYENLIDLLVKNNYSVTSELSGGFDSRVVFSIYKDLLQTGTPISVSSYNDNLSCHSEDFKIASKIAATYGFELNAVSDPQGIPVDPQDSIMLTMYAKMFVHDEFYYRSEYFEKPVFMVGGGGGEAMRGYGVGSIEDYISNVESNSRFGALDYRASNRKFLDNVFTRISRNCNFKIEDAQLMYLHTRIKNHYLRSSVERLLANNIVILPLTDPILTKLDISKTGVPEPRALFALIYHMYLPEIANLEIEGGRQIGVESWNNAIIFKNTFKRQEFNKIEQINLCMHNYLIEHNIIKSQKNISPQEYMLNMFGTDDVKNTISQDLGYDAYIKAERYEKLNNYFGDRYINKLNSYYLLKRCLRSSLFLLISDDIYYRTGNIEKLIKCLNTSRIDIKNYGSETNSVEIFEYNKDYSYIDYPGWFKTSQGIGLMYETWEGKINFLFRTKGKGNLKISFMATDKRDIAEKRIPYQIDYITISIFSISKNKMIGTYANQMGISHDSQFTVNYTCDDREEISIKSQYKPHDYKKWELDIITAMHFSTY